MRVFVAGPVAWNRLVYLDELPDSSDRMPKYRDFLRAQIDRGARLAVCTHGADGAFLTTYFGGGPDLYPTR